ncbi:hypothetical protein KC968_01740 [Candidatus Saccharibacteria bacterium]|nr:hypothetical protein [Candidatus Saccharibacteria bacterium]
MNPDNQFQQPQQAPIQAMPPSPGLPPAGQQLMQAPPAQYPQIGVSASEQKKHHPWGLIIALIIFVLGFLGSSGFGFWAYAQMQDYKNNVDKKVSAAVEQAVEETKAVKEKEFEERSKDPNKKYKGPATFGAVEITYPKTWSATVTEGDGGTPVNGYFHPDFVPGPKSGTAFALRLEVIEQPYDRVLSTYDSDAKKGSVKVSPYKAGRVQSVLGARLDGEIEKDMQGSTVLFPLRDKTIRISTLSGESFGKDFNDIVLKNLIFTP